MAWHRRTRRSGAGEDGAYQHCWQGMWAHVLTRRECRRLGGLAKASVLYFIWTALRCQNHERSSSHGILSIDVCTSLCQVFIKQAVQRRRHEGRLTSGRTLIRIGTRLQQELYTSGDRPSGPMLKHGRQRSRGVGRLYRQYQGQISRRDLQALTETVRREYAQQHQAELRRITWHVPGLVWSLDDTELVRLARHQLRLHQGQDLASR